MTEEFDPEIHDGYDPEQHSFHVDAHPKAKQPTGDRNYGMWGQCITDSSTTDERCGGTAKGPHGKCHWHGGATPSKDENPAQGAPEDNTNAEGHAGVETFEEGNTASVEHGAYMDELTFYAEEISEPLKALVNDIYADYYAAFVERHGEPRMGEDLELFRLANTHVKDIVLDNWATDRPDSLAESGNPLVDRETHVSENGHEYYRYKESVVIAAQQKLSRDRLRWLKALGLDRSAETNAADSLTDLATAMMQTLQDEYDDGDKEVAV